MSFNDTSFIEKFAICSCIMWLDITNFLLSSICNSQDIAAETVKKRRRATKKPFSRSIVGTTLEAIQKRRTEKPEVRDAAREAALRYDFFLLISFPCTHPSPIHALYTMPISTLSQGHNQSSHSYISGICWMVTDIFWDQIHQDSDPCIRNLDLEALLLQQEPTA